MNSGIQDTGVNISYDAVPYPSYSYSDSHPGHLATMATLFGMNPTPVERCRVLGLGCAGGGNLIPMAYALPESEFVGIDLAARQIAEGQENVAALGLKNITLQQMDILAMTADLGQFDYIIAHGVFSWVPRAVQDKVLEINKQNLAPNGVAYVSYNVYPGWHMIDMVRGMMMYHTRDVTDPETRAAQARELLDIMSDAAPVESNAYGSYLKMYSRFLKGQLEEGRPKDDALLLHDELEEINQPLYFHQFAERAARHGLQYLSETEFSAMVGSNLPPEVAKMIGKTAKNVVDLEQYIDFVRNRTFRRTLLCHDDVVLQRRLKPDVIKAFYLASQAKPVSDDADIHSVSVVKFRGPGKAVLSTDHPITKAAMLCLNEAWPQALSFDTLLAAARARLNGQAAVQTHPDAAEGTGVDDVDAKVLAANLLKAYSYSNTLLDLHVYVPSTVLGVSERPMVSPVARLQAQNSSRVTNLYHQRVELDRLDRFLLDKMDGDHDRAALLDLLLTGPVAQGALSVQREGERVGDAKEVERLLGAELDMKLRGFAHAALLVG